MANQRDEPYSEQEAQRRFLVTLKTALNTPPKPLKMMPRKGVAAQSKKRRKTAKKSA
ncbi:hypothetical protein HAP48_0042840 [Bradyrhizobium septentrionale]|uniref:Uncharacterized protein n=1 Tax=Bradyrhizobium septentrionale TaxID=1404411 RepID=A0A973W2J4_9BRAD|nr:hypothetical protein [Bradyrhizobium septentrionale]UGY15196.1 hypothetical protein HAP48_0042840 [Bradyrhizobium septentrionale]